MDELCFPVVAGSNIPTIDVAGMIEVDRRMGSEFAIGIARMMELAGRHLAHLARVRFLSGDAGGKRAIVLVGGGGNGGGALVCARRLADWGATPTLFLAQDPQDMRGAAADQLAVVRNLGIPGTGRAGDPGELAGVRHQADVIIDGLIGYGLRRPPRGTAGALIAAVAPLASKVLALDVPSGLDATTGEAPGPVVRADATMTLALPKTGLHAAAAAAFVGDLYLADIGVPSQLYVSPPLGLDVPAIFARSDILRIER